jgi:hypothetical protein
MIRVDRRTIRVEDAIEDADERGKEIHERRRKVEGKAKESFHLPCFRSKRRIRL